MGEMRVPSSSRRMGLCKSGLKLSLLPMGGRDGRAAIARVADGVWDVVGVVDGVVVARSG
jgi:hypothetical protein